MGELVGLVPADQLLSLEGLYERYGLDEKARRAIEERILEKYESEPLRCEYGHEVVGHTTVDGWCCACEADMAFAESWLRETKPEIFRPATNE